MRLLRARLRNFCQYADTLIDFDPRLTAIRGPIGSGKTNLLNGVVYALAGDLSRLPGVKAANVRNGSDGAEPSFVQVWFEHGGVKACVSRSLREKDRDHTFLETNDEPSGRLTKVKDIDARLESLLGVSKKLLLDYVFVEQWKIFDFLLRPDSETVQGFSQLFGFDRAATIYRCLGEARIDIPALEIDGDVVVARLKAHLKEMVELEARLSGYAYLGDSWAAAQDPDYKVIQCWDKVKMLLASHQTVSYRRQNVLTELEPVSQNEKLACAKLEARQKEWEALTARSDEMQDAAMAWHRYDESVRAMNNARAAVELYRGVLNQMVPPVCPDDYIDSSSRSAYQMKLADLLSRSRWLHEFINLFDPHTGKADCPVCSTPAYGLQEQYQQFKEVELPQVEDSCRRLADQLDRSARYDRDQSVHEQKYQKHLQLATIAEKQLLEFEAVPMPTVARHAIEEWQACRLTLHRSIQELQTDCTRVTRSRSQLEGQLQVLTAESECLAAELASINICPDDVTRARESLQKKSTDWETKKWCMSRRDFLNQVICDDQATLAKYQQQSIRRARSQMAADQLASLRELFHHEGPVKRAAQERLEFMHGEINEVLAEFDASFRVAEIRQLRFVVRKRGGEVLPASRLSGGEKVIMAMAFRIVVNSLFANDLGLLCLDEPTAGLDEANLACLDTALGRLRSLSTSRGLQVVLITHEKGLDRLFDRVIDLGTTAPLVS